MIALFNFFILYFFVFVRIASANNSNPPIPPADNGQGVINPVLPFAGTGDAAQAAVIFGNIVSAIIGLFLIVGFIMAIFHFIFGAVRWITASGDKNNLQNAQERMTQAVVGLIILASVWAIVALIYTFIGWDQGPHGSFVFPLPDIENIWN